MEDRVQEEQAAGDERYDAAFAAVEAEKARLTQEMSDAIADSIASFEATLAKGKADCDAARQAAQDCLYAFIDARLADWGAKADAERINAEWQEDSYYRYNLLRLLGEKQDAIDQAVADAQAAWTADNNAVAADGVAWRALRRQLFAEFTADVRQAHADAQAQDWADIEAIVADRTASLDARLADQQAQHTANIEATRATFKHNLKEVYNYNSYDIETTSH